MTINRHPLQAQGAGQAERQLPDEAVVGYCDRLGDRLTWLGKVIGEEQKEGRISQAASQATHTFLHELRGTVMVMALKHARQLLDIEPVPLTIDPTESGMPTFKDFWQLRDDCEHAQEQLEQIPARDVLMEQAIDAIYHGDRPVKQQILWLQRAYMVRLAATPVVADFRVFDPVQISALGNDHVYAVSWSGVIRSVNLFECTTMHFIERGGWHVNGGVEQLRGLVQEFEHGHHGLQEMLGMCNEAGWIVPQTIERVTIGPYYHRWTENDDFIKQAFAVDADNDPWMLRCTIERAATTKAIQRSTMDKLLGREPMASGPSIKSTALLVPLRLKQQLGDRDEDGNVCAVYGLSKDGDLVC